MLKSSNLTSLRMLTNSYIISSLMVSTISTSRSFSIIGPSLISSTILILYSSSIAMSSLIYSKISIFSSRKIRYSTYNSSLNGRIYGAPNNSSVNFLAKNNLVLYMIEVHHNPKDKI